MDLFPLLLLPNELIADVLGHLDGYRRCSLLGLCAVSCRRLSRIASEALWASPSVGAFEDAESFREACEADSERLLRTRSILFTHWCESWFIGADSYVAKMPELEEVIFRSEESTYWATVPARCKRLLAARVSSKSLCTTCGCWVCRRL